MTGMPEADLEHLEALLGRHVQTLEELHGRRLGLVVWQARNARLVEQLLHEGHMLFRQCPYVDLCNVFIGGWHEDVHTVGSAADVRIDPAQVFLQTIGVGTRHTEHPQATGLGNLYHHVAAV